MTLMTPSATNAHLVDESQELYIHSYLYEPEGSKDAVRPLILLLHGAGGDHHLFDGMIEPLQAHGYRVLLCDLRFHGASWPFIAIWSNNERVVNLDMAVLASDTLKVLDWYANKQVSTPLILGGVSLGGIAVQHVARQMMANPLDGSYTLSALVAIGCPHVDISDPQIAWIPFYKTATYEQAEEYLPAARRNIIGSCYTASGRALAKKALDNVHDRVLFACFRSCATSSASALSPMPTWLPQLLLRGERDEQTEDIMTAWYKYTRERSPDTRIAYEIVPSAGHLAPLDAPSLVSSAILAFLSA
ncbi:Alpha/Beta hydrolase protein [Gongronella butleri]|nr:Alpha/Beta hydrolase protein [Gongronella butleri]